MAETASDNLTVASYDKSKCFHDCEATLLIGEVKTEVLVCKEQLAKISEYFQVMFFGDFKEKNKMEFEISDETPENMICFFNAIDPKPKVNEISGDSVELLMRLADKYQCDLLKERLNIYIKSNEPNCKSPSTMLNWLIWSVKYNMPTEIVKVCLPGVASLPLSTILVNRDKIGTDLTDQLIAAKFEVLFDAAKFHYLYLEKKISDQSQFYSCNKCGVKLGLFPYRFCLTNNIGYYTSCNSCSSQNCSRCVTGWTHYYKCKSCSNDPSSYKNSDQCFCSRKNYEALFNKPSA